MEFDAFTVRLAILALPGIVAAGIQNANRHSSANRDFSFILRTFVWALLAYAVTYALYYAIGSNFDLATDPSAENALAPAIDEISVACTVAAAFGVMSVLASSKKWVPRFLNWSRISTFSGCDDIWEYALDHATCASKWVQVRDYENALIYSGCTKSFSDSPNVREILLVNVSVYGLTTAKVLYTVPAMYLSMPIDKCVIEFQEVEDG